MDVPDAILEFIVLLQNSNFMVRQVVHDSDDVELVIEVLLLVQQFRLFDSGSLSLL